LIDGGSPRSLCGFSAAEFSLRRDDLARLAQNVFFGSTRTGSSTARRARSLSCGRDCNFGKR